MIGLIVLFIIALWVMAVTKLTKFLNRWIPVNKFSPVLKVLLFMLLLVMPFMDEIIGGFQFRALCKTEAVATYDEAKVRGKTVHNKSAIDKSYENTILPTYKTTVEFVDHSTNEGLISYTRLHSDGGWLSRWIDFNGVHSPQTFDGSCSGDKNGYLFQDLNIKYVNKD